MSVNPELDAVKKLSSRVILLLASGNVNIFMFGQALVAHGFTDDMGLNGALSSCSDAEKASKLLCMVSAQVKLNPEKFFKAYVDVLREFSPLELLADKTMSCLQPETNSTSKAVKRPPSPILLTCKSSTGASIRIESSLSAHKRCRIAFLGMCLPTPTSGRSVSDDQLKRGDYLYDFCIDKYDELVDKYRELLKMEGQAWEVGRGSLEEQTEVCNKLRSEVSELEREMSQLETELCLAREMLLRASVVTGTAVGSVFRRVGAAVGSATGATLGFFSSYLDNQQVYSGQVDNRKMDLNAIKREIDLKEKLLKEKKLELQLKVEQLEREEFKLGLWKDAQKRFEQLHGCTGAAASHTCPCTCH